MESTKRIITLGSGVFALMLAGPAMAFVPWDNPSGSTADFFWLNGGSDNGLFGSPTVTGNSFIFFPQAFNASSTNGVADQTNDRLQFELIAKPGFVFNGIAITEIGDYTISGVGSVSVTAGLFVTDLNGFRVADDHFSQTFNSGAANWSGTPSVDLSIMPPDWVHVMVVLDNVLAATSQANSTSFIEKKVTGGVIITIPSPASASMLILGGLAFGRRRR